MATKVYRPSPFGTAIYPWVNRPDTKFDKEGRGGQFKLDLRCGVHEPGVKETMSLVEGEAGAAFALETEALTPGERKKWSTFLPYTMEEDDQGNPTGFVIFHFRQNAKIKLKDGTTKDIEISLRDMGNQDTRVPVFGGAVVRAKFSTRSIKVVSNKVAGVRLDFASVQIKDPGQRGSGARDDFESGEGWHDDDDAAEARGFDGGAPTKAEPAKPPVGDY